MKLLYFHYFLESEGALWGKEYKGEWERKGVGDKHSSTKRQPTTHNPQEEEEERERENGKQI